LSSGQKKFITKVEVVVIFEGERWQLQRTKKTMPAANKTMRLTLMTLAAFFFFFFP
jgi:hypothetical protein